MKCVKVETVLFKRHHEDTNWFIRFDHMKFGMKQSISSLTSLRALCEQQQNDFDIRMWL